MKDMNRVKVTVIGVIAALAVNFMGVDKVQAQEFKIQGDLVSSYVWRGFYQTGVSFQPTLGFGIGGFALTAWGSTDFDGTSSSLLDFQYMADPTAVVHDGRIYVYGTNDHQHHCRKQ